MAEFIERNTINFNTIGSSESSSDTDSDYTAPPSPGVSRKSDESLPKIVKLRANIDLPFKQQFQEAQHLLRNNYFELILHCFHLIVIRAINLANQIRILSEGKLEYTVRTGTRIQEASGIILEDEDVPTVSKWNQSAILFHLFQPAKGRAEGSP